jgi:hypothetical protein
MNISSKVLLIAFVTPIVALLIILFCLFMLHYEAGFHVIISFVTAVSVFVLVWERLHEMVSHRLEYIHEHVLCKLHENCSFNKNNIQYGGLYPSSYLEKENIQKLVDKLKRLGAFIYIIKLYPKEITSPLQKLSHIAEKYNKNIEELKKFKKDNNLDYNPTILAYFLELIDINLDDFASEVVNRTREFFKLLKEKEPRLAEDLCKLWLLLTKQSNEVLRKLESFMEENSLTIPHK